MLNFCGKKKCGLRDRRSTTTININLLGGTGTYIPTGSFETNKRLTIMRINWALEVVSLLRVMLYWKKYSQNASLLEWRLRDYAFIAKQSCENESMLRKELNTVYNLSRIHDTNVLYQNYASVSIWLTAGINADLNTLKKSKRNWHSLLSKQERTTYKCLTLCYRESS